MGESDSDNTSYLIKGHKVNGILGQRLAETAASGINQLPGVLVPTSKGVFYSELYVLGQAEAIPRRDLNETTHGLIERVTEEMANKRMKAFTIRRSPQYYQGHPQTHPNTPKKRYLILSRKDS